MIVRAQPTSGFHLMATRANQLPKLGPTLMVTSRRVPKEGGSLTMTAQSDPTSGFHPNGYPSQSTTYIRSYPDGYPSRESHERQRLAHNDRSELSLYRVFTLTATRASQQPISGPILMATFRGVS